MLWHFLIYSDGVKRTRKQKLRLLLAVRLMKPLLLAVLPMRLLLLAVRLTRNPQPAVLPAVQVIRNNSLKSPKMFPMGFPVGKPQ